MVLVNYIKRNFFTILALSILIYFFIDNYAHASATVKTGLEIEDWLDRFQKFISGPVAKTLAFVAIVGCAAVLLFVQDISAWMKTLVMVILASSLVMTATNVLNYVSGSGALII